MTCLNYFVLLFLILRTMKYFYFSSWFKIDDKTCPFTNVKETNEVRGRNLQRSFKRSLLEEK